MKVIIEKTNEDREVPAEINDVIDKAIEWTLKHFDIAFDVEVSVLFTDGEGIRKINNDFRQIDKETDVLSFPQFEFFKPGEFAEEFIGDIMPLGDVVLNLDKIFSQAEEFGHSNEHEAGYLTIHSMLHLLGYDHMTEEDKKIMRDKEKIIVSQLGIWLKFYEIRICINYR